MPKRAAGQPLALGSNARARLGSAVRALLGAVSVDGLSHPIRDAVRLAVLVLASRTPSETGVVEIRTGELGRWLGLSASYVASAVLPVLRRSGVVSVGTTEGEFGQDTGLECRVLPLWAAQDVVGHPLALTKKEYATLLRLLEAVMAPGWTLRDGRVIPAGLLGTRTGRGAATDRLALLLLVLEARETGRVRQCGGAVDTKRGRAAATVARLLGCTVSAGERVLERLEDRDLVRRVRLQTVSGLANRTRLMVPAVAAAHGHAGVDDVREDRATAPKPVFSDPDAAARASDDSEQETEPQFSGVLVADEVDVAEPDGAATLHTDHPHLVSPVVPLRLSGRCSDERRGGGRRRPERARGREDQAVDGEDEAAQCASPTAQGGPLRGEKPQESSPDKRDGQQAAGTGSSSRPQATGGGKAQRQGRVGRLSEAGLRVVVGPVVGLWQQLNRWQQQRVEQTAAVEVERIAQLLQRPETAPQLLADRLVDRLEETGGESWVRDPFGWLTGFGLVQRQACTDLRCDDGIRLDTGGDCDNCANVLHTRRAWRARISAKVDAQMPGLSEGERRAAIEERLRQRTALEAEDLVWRREQAAAEQTRRAVARAQAQARAEGERAATLAAGQALPCADCGREQAAGLCEACGYRRRIEALTVETGLVAATWSAALDDQGAVAAVAADVRASLQDDVATSRRAFLDLVDPRELHANPVAAQFAFAFDAFQAVQQAAPEYRRCALVMLGRTEEADAEAQRAYTTERNRRWFRANPTGADAIAAATKAADAARERTAQYLLSVRLEQLRELAASRTERAVPGPWPDRLPELAARPRDSRPAGAVSV